MKSYGKNREFWFLIIVLVAFAVLAQAADVKVDCSKKNASINATLATLTKQGPNSIHVSGACNENVIIDGYEDLTLIANPGASINDPTPSIPDDNDVVDIIESRNVTVQGFTINGGFDSVVCYQFSVCYLSNLTVQGAADVGVSFIWSSGFVTDNTLIQNNGFGGIIVTNNSTVFVGPGIKVFFGPNHTTTGVTIQNNGTSDGGGTAVSVGSGGNLTLNTVTIQNHPYADGVVADSGSVLRLVNSTITGSGGDGVRLQSSVARFQGGGNTITGNGDNGVAVLDASSLYIGGRTTITGNGGNGTGGNGIRLRHLSFLSLSGTRTISGNSAPDVNCLVTTAKTIGVFTRGVLNLGGGTTNCTEPAP